MFVTQSLAKSLPGEYHVLLGSDRDSQALDKVLHEQFEQTDFTIEEWMRRVRLYDLSKSKEGKDWVNFINCEHIDAIVTSQTHVWLEHNNDEHAEEYYL